MGRRRTFTESEVIRSATATFTERGFAGASVDDLVRATGVNRASLYGVFGSKDALFQRCLTEALSVLISGTYQADPVATPDAAASTGHEQLDLILVALMEIAPRDPALRENLKASMNRAGVTAELLGRRLLDRACSPTPDSVASGSTSPNPPQV